MEGPTVVLNRDNTDLTPQGARKPESA